MNENEIIKRCQNGEKAAFDELIHIFYSYITKYLLKLTHDDTLTEDLTQDVFLKMIRTVQNYKIGRRASFANYIITIAKNTFIDYTRKNKVIFSEPSEAEQKSGDNIVNKVINNMQYRKIGQYIDTLPPEQARVICCRFKAAACVIRVGKNNNCCFKGDVKKVHPL